METSANSKPGIDLRALHQQIVATVASNAVEMVREMIDEANDGNCAAMKYLFQMIGLFPATNDEEDEEDESLVRLLLRRLGLPEDAEAAKAVEAARLNTRGGERLLNTDY